MNGKRLAAGGSVAERDVSEVREAPSFIIIVHYDSIGPFGAETSNPGADDDMSGMATAGLAAISSCPGA